MQASWLLRGALKSCGSSFLLLYPVSLVATQSNKNGLRLLLLGFVWSLHEFNGSEDVISPSRLSGPLSQSCLLWIFYVAAGEEKG